LAGTYVRFSTIADLSALYSATRLIVDGPPIAAAPDRHEHLSFVHPCINIDL
jgi:hypothetical protein